VQRLLLVEQNLLFRQGLALLLEWHTGLSGVHAGTLAEAKSVLEDANQMPVCVIVDLDLPDGDATELLKQLDGVPALALIKGGSLERQAEAIGLGADEVVNTKGAVEEIVAAVERLIGQARAPSSSGEAKKYTGRLPWSRP
jgi:DNA-binding NarL/FixJ family response regulator